MSKDGDSFAYVSVRIDAQKNAGTDELVIYDVVQKTERRVELNSYSCAGSEIPKAAKFTNYSGSSCNSSQKITKLVAWLKDKVTFLFDSAAGVFSYNIDDNSKSGYLPIDGSDLLFSPAERYLTYNVNSWDSSGCISSWNRWAMSSLLNLTAD